MRASNHALVNTSRIKSESFGIQIYIPHTLYALQNWFIEFSIYWHDFITSRSVESISICPYWYWMRRKRNRYIYMLESSTSNQFLFYLFGLRQIDFNRVNEAKYSKTQQLSSIELIMHKYWNYFRWYSSWFL